MPTYEYACRDCGEHLEVVQSFKDEPLTVCGSCGGGLRKVFSAAGIIFKGSGYYVTDTRAATAGKSGAGAKGTGGSGAGEGGTSDSSSTSDSGSTSGGDSAASGSKSGSEGGSKSTGKDTGSSSAAKSA